MSLSPVVDSEVKTTPDVTTGDEDNEEMEQASLSRSTQPQPAKVGPLPLRRIENFIAAKDINDSNQKKAMLLCYAGEEVFDLSDSLDIVADRTYDETKHILCHSAMTNDNVEFEVFVFC